MSWSKIKKAINSTLGTSKFKPLDKIVEEGFDEVKEKQDAIGKVANSTLDALETGNNEFKVKYADFLTGIFAKKIATASIDTNYWNYDLSASGAGLYMIVAREDESKGSPYDEHTAFVYYNGGTSSSVRYTSTAINYGSGIRSFDVYQGILRISRSAFSNSVHNVYKLNLSFEN